jgi:hypothetical protein
MKVKTAYLQMLARPERIVPPPREGFVVVHAKAPSVAYYRCLYDAVGRDYDYDKHSVSGTGGGGWLR